MLSNAYFLAKFRFDTAENEPAKNLQNFRPAPGEGVLAHVPEARTPSPLLPHLAPLAALVHPRADLGVPRNRSQVRAQG